MLDRSFRIVTASFFAIILSGLLLNVPLACPECKGTGYVQGGTPQVTIMDISGKLKDTVCGGQIWNCSFIIENNNSIGLNLSMTIIAQLESNLTEIGRTRLTVYAPAKAQSGFWGLLMLTRGGEDRLVFHVEASDKTTNLRNVECSLCGGTGKVKAFLQLLRKE